MVSSSIIEMKSELSLQRFVFFSSRKTKAVFVLISGIKLAYFIQR